MNSLTNQRYLVDNNIHILGGLLLPYFHMQLQNIRDSGFILVDGTFAIKNRKHFTAP
jgi:hypothetical protein